MKHFKILMGLFLFQVVFATCKTTGQLVQGSAASLADVVSADVLGNVYISGSGNTINKYVNANLKFTQNIKLYGTLTSMDVSNPMEIYVFFKDAAQVLFLDNTLSFRGSMDLSGKGMVTCMCRSFDNGIWLFDQAEMQLKKSDKSGNILQTAGNAAMTGARQLNPFAMQDDGNYIYVADSTSGFYVYDLNANFVKKISVPGVTAFYAESHQLRYISNGKIYECDVRTGMIKTLGNTKYKGVLVRDRLYYSCMDSIYCTLRL